MPIGRLTFQALQAFFYAQNGAPNLVFYGQKMVKGDIYALPGLAGASAVAVDAAGNVLFGDNNDYLVRMLAEKSGDYYGVKARAGHVYTIAGNGKFPL